MPEVFRGKHGFYPISYETYLEMKKNHQRLLTAYREVKYLWYLARQPGVVADVSQQLVNRVRALYADAGSLLSIVLGGTGSTANWAPINHDACGWQLPVEDTTMANGTRKVSYEPVSTALCKLLPAGVRLLRRIHAAYLSEYTRARRPVATEAEVKPISFAKLPLPYGPESAVKAVQAANRLKLSPEDIVVLGLLLGLALPVTGETHPAVAL